jgi:hypothetical protein
VPRVDDWHASAEAAPLHDADPPANYLTDDGEYYTVVTDSSGPAPETIERVHVPVSKAWTCDTELVTVAPRHAETRRRGGERLAHFVGVTTGEGPTGGSWGVRFDVVAYPLTEYHRAGLRLAEGVDYAAVPPETLIEVVAER